MARQARLSQPTPPLLDSRQSKQAPRFATEQIYLRLAQEESEGHWEFHGGMLREKPGMGSEHNDVMLYLAASLIQQLKGGEFRVRSNSARLRQSPDHYYIPDVVVVPTSLFQQMLGQPGRLEVYDAPLPLVVEVWSPSTGGYDVDAKLPAYQRRGDLEIWRLHPFERTLTAWRRQEDGSYVERVFHGGVVQPVALPNVTIDLDALFDFR